MVFECLWFPVILFAGCLFLGFCLCVLICCLRDFVDYYVCCVFVVVDLCFWCAIMPAVFCLPVLMFCGFVVFLLGSLIIFFRCFGVWCFDSLGSGCFG